MDDAAVRIICEQTLALGSLGLHTNSDGEEESNDGEDADHDDGCLKRNEGICSW